MRNKIRISARGLVCVLMCACVCIPPLVSATARQTIIKKSIESNVDVVIREGRVVYLEVSGDGSPLTKSQVARYLAKESAWQSFVNGRYAQIPLLSLNDDTQRSVVGVLFPDDYWSKTGWVHFVKYGPETGGETLWSISEWFTGKGMLNAKIKAFNGKRSNRLGKGEKIVIPANLLGNAFDHERTEPVYLGMTVGDLTYKRDDRGDYALYAVKKGETLYSDVVGRFTPRTDNEDVHAAVRSISARSGIRNANRLSVGQTIKIPIELLSSKYRPYGDSARTRYEEYARSTPVSRPRVHMTKLAGVHVILDPGHGGHDPGKIGKFKTQEDEYVYDITCRVKRLLEQQTRAKVFMTMLDESAGYTPIDKNALEVDKDEVLLTHPRYENNGKNGDSKISVNLRWYLANSIYRRLVKSGVDPENIVFTSFHADSRHYRLRGTMVYYPDAHFCRGRFGKNSSEYRKYSEVRERPYIEFDFKSRLKAQHLSKSLADQIAETFRTPRKHNIAVHRAEPVRGVVRRRIRGRYAEYVPAVIRYNEVPTRVLIETVNLGNSTDCDRIRGWQFRERVARAYVDALDTFFRS